MLHPVPAPKAPARPRLLVRRLTRPGLFLLVAAAGTSALLGPGAAASAATPSHGAHSTLDSGTASNGGKHATITPAYSTGNSGQHLGRKPKATPTPGPTATPYPTPTATPASTATPAPTNTPAPPPPATPRPTATPVPTPQPTSQPTATPRPTATPVPTPQPTPQPTATPSPTGAPSSTATPGTGSPAKGMAAHFMWQSLADTNTDLDRMQAAGMSYVRFDVSWRNSEPTKGSYLYLDKLDQVISAVQSRGMTLTMTVIETPSWANGGAGMFAPPSNPADYASFMGVLARRYAGRAGMVWEIWNEENDAHFWTTGPNAAQYTAMLKPAYAAVKQADPDATVIVGGILFNNTAFLDGIYANGGGSSFDGIAIHPYTINRAPGDTSSTYYGFANSVPQFRTVFANHGQTGKPIWITELGWSTSVVSDATRATWFRDAVGIARSWTDVRGIAAYTIRQSQFAEYGLFTTAGVPTASWTAYAAAQ